MRYREFATEALKPSEYRPLVKGWDKAKYAELFGGQYRIYIPLETSEPVNKTVKINPQVKQEVEKLGYTIDDYLKGIAVKTENGRVRQIKIGKLLSPATAKIFANDPVRGATRQSNQMVVISRHPYDIAGMSTDRGWDSCMNLRKEGNNKRYVPLDIKAGSVVAYLINANDKNINRPQARMLIKPFVNVLGNHEIAFGVENTVYGTAPPEFVKTVSDWVDKINASRQLNGVFELDPSVYPEIDVKQKFIGKDKETWLNSIDESTQISVLKKDPKLIKYIKDPSEKVQLAAVRIGDVIEFIITNGIKPSERVQRAAVAYWGNAIGNIIKAGITPSETVQLAAVTRLGHSISHIIKAGITPSETVQRAAVETDGGIIEYIIEAGITPSEAVQEAAVSKYGYAIDYIIKAGIKPSETVLQTSVSLSGNVILNIIKAGIKPSEDVQAIAVANSFDAIKYIIKSGINPSERVQIASVKANGDSIQFIIKAGITPSETVQLESIIESSGRTIYDILDTGITPSEDVQLAAVGWYAGAIAAILNADITPSERVQMMAVSRHKNGIDYIIIKGNITPSERVQILAVTKYPKHAMDVIIRAGITPSPAVKQAAEQT
jgi:ribosomal protein S16